ncbi:MAG: tRNA-guanine transglycosylase, partial [Candidatus Eremiobacteraeota bacterium]|nr:tRNA-guanine transglycosylase [Candidatus Eremiobacteraeota bacterium]
MFKLHGQDGSARRGRLTLAHGVVETPCFMPVGTAATVKGLTPADLRDAMTQIVLANAYHLWLRPGRDTIEAAGGLHRFMGWNGPILTDSGGFQVFSLQTRRTLDDDGVTFRSHLDGSEHRFTPENVIEFQQAIGSDVAMVLDVCVPLPAAPEVLEEAVRLTTLWARRSV